MERSADIDCSVPIGPDRRRERFRGTEFTNEVKTHKRFEKKRSTQSDSGREERKRSGGKESRASFEKKKECALNPMLLRRDGFDRNFGTVRSRVCSRKCSFSRLLASIGKTTQR